LSARPSRRFPNSAEKAVRAPGQRLDIGECSAATIFGVQPLESLPSFGRVDNHATWGTMSEQIGPVRVGPAFFNNETSS